MTARSGFQPSCEVTDPKYLFGHNRTGGLIEQVITYLRLGTNIQILGERRSGKTSILKCCMTMLHQETHHLIPVYLNYREYHLTRGYASAYRLLLAHVHTSVLQAGCSDPPSAIYGTVVFSSELSPEIHLQMLNAVPDYQVNTLVTSYFRALNERGIGVVLFLDEYEHLLRHTFEAREGAFFLLREVSSAAPLKPGLSKPLTYVIAGASPWDQICEVIGSPELNNIGAVFYVEPLDYTSFEEMWCQCVEDSSPEVKNQMRHSRVDLPTVYRLAGGWPFYGKVIGDHLGIGCEEEHIFYESLLQHFGVIWSRLSAKERDQLIQAENWQLPNTNAAARSLVRRGLLETDPDGVLIPRGILWERFIREQPLQSTGERPTLPPFASPNIHEKLTLLVDDIAVLITEINETSLNVSREEVFRCSNQDVQIYFDLRTPATDQTQFAHFALSLYNLLFERTSGPRLVSVVAPDGKNVVEEMRIRALERLPKLFRHKKTVVRVTDTTRHHFGKGHLTRLDTFNVTGSAMPIEGVLERYLGSKAAPRDDQFLELQHGILRDLLAYLEQLRDYQNEEACHSANSASG